MPYRSLTFALIYPKWDPLQPGRHLPTTADNNESTNLPISLQGVNVSPPVRLSLLLALPTQPASVRWLPAAIGSNDVPQNQPRSGDSYLAWGASPR